MPTAESLEQLIAQHPFLAGFPIRFHSFLSECASLRRFGWQQEIFQEGGEADHFYLILKGKVNLECTMPDGVTLVIQTLGAGDALGWSWLFEPYQWRFTARTAAPTEVLSFGAESLRRKASEEPMFGNELLRRTAKTLAQRLQAARDELAQLYHLTNEHKQAAGIRVL